LKSIRLASEELTKALGKHGPSENYVNQSLGKLPNLQGCGIITERSEEVAVAEGLFRFVGSAQK